MDQMRGDHPAQADPDAVPYHTRYYRKRGRPSRLEKAQGQQYLTPDEEKALALYLLLMTELGQPVRIKHIPTLAHSLARRRATATGRPKKPPGKNWARSFKKRNTKLTSRKVHSIDWKRHERNIYPKVTHWFEIIQKVMQDPAVQLKPELGTKVIILHLCPWLYYIAHWCCRTNVWG
jgi:hypothetical protein